MSRDLDQEAAVPPDVSADRIMKLVMDDGPKGVPWRTA